MLFEGEALGVGETDAMFRRYYEATGFLDRNLKPMGIAPEMPEDFDPTGTLASIVVLAGEDGLNRMTCGDALALSLVWGGLPQDAVLILQFWSPSGLLLASAEATPWSAGRWQFEIPRLGLAAGRYRVAAGIWGEKDWLGYAREIAELAVSEDGLGKPQGLFRLEAKLTPAI